MENFSNKQGPLGQSGQTKTIDKNSGYDGLRPDHYEKKLGEGVGNIADEAQKKIREGKEYTDKFICALNKQVRENPWLVIAGVAVGSFFLASLFGRANKQNAI